jgi:hypothetical protein
MDGVPVTVMQQTSLDSPSGENSEKKRGKRKRTTINRRPSMYLDSEGPIAKAVEKRSVEIETKSAHGFKFRTLKINNMSTK